MPDLTTQVAEEISGLKADISKQFDDKIKDLDRKADERWEELKKTPDAVIGESLKAILDDAVKTREEKIDAFEKAVTDRLDEMEAKAKERSVAFSGDVDAEIHKALDDFEYKPKTKGDTANLTLPVKAVTTITTALAGGEEFYGPRQGILQYPQRPLALRDLIAPGTISGNYFKYEREKPDMEGDADYQGGTGSAAEGELKPTIDMYTEIVTHEVATIAVTSRTSQQIFDDRPAFISFLRQRMGYRTLRKLDVEILNGTGAAGEIDGINTNATAFDGTLNTSTGVAGATIQRVDILRNARLQIELNHYVPDGAVLHPTDWASIELLKDGDERYLIGDPRTGGSTGVGRVGAIWGMPVVSTAGQDTGDFTVGDFMGASQLFMRQELEILASTEDQDNFVRNLVTLRAELRALLAIYSTAAFVTGDFTSALAAT